MLICCKHSHCLIDSHVASRDSSDFYLKYYAGSSLTSSACTRCKFEVKGCLIAGSPATNSPHVRIVQFVIQVAKR